MDATCYGFTVEWYDKQADMIREYALTAYEQLRGPLEVAMYDPKAQRSFLKRVQIPGLTLQDLHVGGTISVYARQLKITKYNNSKTKEAVEAVDDRVSLLMMPAAFPRLGEAVEALEGAGLRIARLRLVNDNGPVVALQVSGTGVNDRWKAASGSMPSGCMQKVSGEEVECYFDRARFPSTAALSHCSLCMIRPHMVKDGGVGAVLSAIMQAGLEVSAAELLHLERAQAAELFDVYKGVLPFYTEIIECMTAGPVVALEIRASHGAVPRLREVVGPYDVEIARHLRPQSLRARFGKDNIQNCVHVTDLEEDGDVEVAYVFDSLLGK